VANLDLAEHQAATRREPQQPGATVAGLVFIGGETVGFDQIGRALDALPVKRRISLLNCGRRASVCF
jgi:hypothetical protein